MEEEKGRIEAQREYTGENRVDPLISEYELSEDYQVQWRTLAAIVALALGNICAAMSNTTNTVVRSQVSDLGDSALQSWIVNSNFLVTLAFGPVFGFLSDRFGKKWFIMVPAAVGVIGSVVAGSAKQTMTIIGGQSLTGLANAGCVIGVPAALEVSPNKYRPWVQGFVMAFTSFAVVAGTLAAGDFAKVYDQGWRWSYYLNACVYGLTTVMVFVFYHPPPTGLRRQEGSAISFLKKIDYIGIFIFTGSLAAFIIALTWGGTTYAWSSGQVLAPLIISIAGLIGFGVYERVGTTEGIFDHRLFFNRNFPILLIVCAIDGMLLLGVNVILAQQIAIVFTSDTLKVAEYLMPYLAISAFGCIPAGYIMGKMQRYRLFLVLALAWCALFTGLMALLNPDRLNWMFAFSALFGAGTAVTTVIPIAALSLSVPSFLLGTAGTLSVCSRAFGGIIGITIFTAIYDNKLSEVLPGDVSQVLLSDPAIPASSLSTLLPQVLASFDTTNPPATLAAIQGLPAAMVPACLGAFEDANTYAWKYVWIAIASLVAFNAIVACFLKPVKDRMNNHIESALEESEARQKQLMN
ncbi:major facilitator superfamily domain-containing protein [Coniella lustricola]|uniref:Major facilitator superfamily domain-containing protein n=1 Tax=Coniella lustricola TaxID=2025994 RepID=A0A2T3AI74_9PEZI|nr:major facilitator superfamily domain-containing protein [Coniella lustricola]